MDRCRPGVVAFVDCDCDLFVHELELVEVAMSPACLFLCVLQAVEDDDLPVGRSWRARAKPWSWSWGRDEWQSVASQTYMWDDW